MKLTDTQLKTHQNEEETKLKVAQLKHEIKLKEDVIANLKQKKAEKKKSSGHSRKSSKTSLDDVKEEASKKLEIDCDNLESVVKETADKGLVVTKDPQKQFSHQGNDLRGLVSQWVASAQKVKVVQNEDAAHSSDSENPVSEDVSDSSVTGLDDDESSLTHAQIGVKGESADSCSRRNSTSSNNSQISFDWKKLGRDTIEKIKLLNPAVKDAQDQQRSRSTSPTQESQASISERSGHSLELDIEGTPAATSDVVIVS